MIGRLTLGHYYDALSLRYYLQEQAVFISQEYSLLGYDVV